MIFKQFALVIALVAASCTILRSQYMEAGLVSGVSNYLGDLQNKVELSEYNAAYGFSLRYNFSPKFSVKGNILTAYVSGKDANFKKNTGQAQRNLSFRSDIIEFSMQGEYSPLGYDLLDGKVSTPYVFVGLGAFYFNPQAKLDGTWYDLQPLGTEGQGWTEGVKKYSRLSMSIPMGVGFRFGLSKRMNLGFEIGARKTFTDYLDDVSGTYPNLAAALKVDPLIAQLSYRTPELTGETYGTPVSAVRGNAQKKDWYLIGSVTLSFNLTDRYGMEWEKRYRIYDSE